MADLRRKIIGIFPKNRALSVTKYHCFMRTGAIAYLKKVEN